ncbi:AMP-binding enzyme [Paraphoma chrysanthemicola]|uniref:AMP-binding enzyme n=1 Tax=Paraphoma chrysanthemicola TaxID=798071 RepID=A0A8K0QZT1_9PLEO|nr:AMP-binding enzyme [Paraphoma chrysanthemicola]
MRVYQNETIDIPQDLSLTELLHQSAGGRKLLDSHLIAKDNLSNRSLTIAELRNRAGRIAHGLLERFQPLDQSRWMILVPNSVDYVELVHAILWSGGIACPVNHALVMTEIAHAMIITRPHFIFVYGSELEKVTEAVRLAEKRFVGLKIQWERPQIITVIKRVSGYVHSPDDIIGENILGIPHYDDTSTRLATIHLSSGTTGSPKGVELTHFNYVANCYQLFAHDPSQWPASARHVAYTPYVHIAQTMPVVFFAPWTGMMYHAMPTFDIETYAQLVESNQSTNHLLIPSVALELATSDITIRYDFSSSRSFTVGQLSMDEEQIAKLVSRAPWRIINLYGMTEAAPYVAYQKLEDTLPIGTIGGLLPNLQAMLKKENGEDAPEGGPGELWVRGPNITRGYVFNEGASKAAFPLPGWYNTGDVCTISKEGWLAVVGRTKELIKYKGFQVSPVELETYLGAHPLVHEAAVGGRYDATQLTEVPAGYVILKDPALSAEEKKLALMELHATVDRQVSGYKKLRGGVWEVSELPRNATGKLLRAKLHEARTGLCSLSYGHRLAKL